MKIFVMMLLACLLSGCCSIRGTEGDEIAELQNQRDQLMAMVIKIYQLEDESPEDVLPRVLSSHPAAPSAEEWVSNRSALSLDALVQEVLWLRIIGLTVPESPAMLEKLRKHSEQTDGAVTQESAPSAAP